MYPSTPSSQEHYWLVLLAASPERAEDLLLKANMELEHPFFSGIFVPYTMMGVKTEGRNLTKEKFSLRSALRRYLFVDGDERVLQGLMIEWNRLYRDKMFFLTLDKETKTPARITNHEKELIEKACREQQNFPDLPMPSDGFRVGESLSLVGTPFEHLAEQCKILEVKPRTKAGSIEVRVEVMMFGVPLDNIYISFADAGNYGDYASRVSASQKKLLDIFCRRVDKITTYSSQREDALVLDNIAKDSNLVYREGAMKRHFLALMLICAHLRGDETDVKHFTDAIITELKDISLIRESKAATDTRAYLHIALFIATGEKKYRTLAKHYVAKYKPSSPYLRKFVATISKFSANSLVGPSARRNHVS